MTDTSNKSLTGRVLASSAWLAAGRWGIRLLGLLSTVVLARLLTPYDYGIVALASLAVMMIDSLTDFRFDRALIRYQDATRDEFNTDLTLNVLRGLFMGLVMVAGSWLFADFFKESRLVAVIQVLAIAPVMDDLQNIGMVEYQRDLRFGRDFAYRIVPKLAGVVATIALALFWRSYWALIFGLVAASVARLAMSFVMHPFRPRLALSGWRRLFTFSAWLMGSQAISALNDRLEQLLIGRFLSTSTVGVYNLAYNVGSMATLEITGPAAHSLFPGFAKIATDRPRLRQAYEKSIQLVVAVGTPVGIGLALVAAEFVRIVLGGKWFDVIGPLRILSVCFALSSMVGASRGILTSLGQTQTMFRMNMLQFMIRLPITTAVVWRFDLVGAVWTRFVFGLLWVVQFIWAVHGALDFSLKRVLAATWRTYAASAAMVISVLIAGMLLGPTTDAQLFVAPIGEIWGSVLVKVPIGAATYVLVHLGCWRLQGRPEGIESLVLGAIRRRMSRSRSQA